MIVPAGSTAREVCGPQKSFGQSLVGQGGCCWLRATYLVCQEAPPLAEESTASRVSPLAFWCSALSAKYTWPYSACPAPALRSRPRAATAPPSANQYRPFVLVFTGVAQVRP